MASLPWPTSSISSSVAGAHVPWIPPPPIYGIPTGAPVNNESPYYPYYYANEVAAHGERSPSQAVFTRGAAGDYYTHVNRHLAGCDRWPAPADVPLPSRFPLPPTALPSPTGKTPWPPYPPPPFPNGWTAPPQQSGEHGPRNAQDTDRLDDDDDSSCSSCSECKRIRAGRAEEEAHAASVKRREPVARGAQGLRGKRFTSTAAQRGVERAWEEEPARDEDGRGQETQRAHSRPSVAAAPRASTERSVWPVRRAVEQPQRAISASDSIAPRSASAACGDINRHGSTTSASSSSASSPSTAVSSNESQRRLDAAADRAERMLASIESLYQKLRANYERLARDPDQLTLTATADVETPAQAFLPSPAPRAPVVGQAAVPLAAAAAGARQPSSSKAPVPPPTRPLPGSEHASELRRELLKLESQWKRLEEMKRRDYNVHAATTASVLVDKVDSSCAARDSVTSTLGPTATASASGITASSITNASVNSSAVSRSANGAPGPFDRDRVLQLIRERKAAVGVA